jgi:membrane associated rhomboid family serine protease
MAPFRAEEEILGPGIGPLAIVCYKQGQNTMALGDRDYMRSGSDRLAFPRDWLDPAVVLLLSNGIVFILQHAVGVGVPMRGGGIPEGALTADSLLEGRIWTVLTHLFVHANPFHLLFDMLVLFSVGRSLQSLIGGRRFLYLYFLSGLAGAALNAVLFWLGGNFHAFVTYGATSSVFGLFLGMAAMMPREEVTKFLHLIIPVRARLWTLASVVMAGSFFLGLLQWLWPDKLAFLHGSHFAHLGGAVAGWWYVRMLGYSATPASYDQIRRERQERDRNREFAGIPRKQRVVDLDESDNTLIPPVTTREFIEREIDPILEKIHAHGMESLTVEERRLLERGRKEILNKKKKG